MATTGTYATNPSAADVVMNAYGLIGLRRAQLSTEHFENASYAAQMVGVDFTNRNPNRWQMTTLEIPLIEDIKDYDLEPETVAVSVVYIDTDDAGSPQTRVLGPLSATEYASIANKEQNGVPTSYFFSLLTPTPKLTLWPVPDATPVYTMRVQTFKQQQDFSVRGGLTVDTPYRFLDAFTFGLAARLAVYYPPEKGLDAAALDSVYERKFALAAALDQERVSLKITPGLSGYFPR